MSGQLQRVIDFNISLRDEDEISNWLSLVSSINIFGNLDSQSLQEIVSEATDYGIAIGASPAYPSDDMGKTILQRSRKAGLDTIRESLTKQICRVAMACAREGGSISHVKAYGLLYHDIAVNKDLAEVFLEAIFQAEETLSDQGAHALDLDGDIPVIGLPNSILPNLAKTFGRTFYAEALLNVAYTSEGLLVPQSKSDHLIEEKEAVLEQALSVIKEGSIKSINGSNIFLHVESLSLSLNSANAFALAKEIRDLLLASDVQIKKLGTA